MYIEDALGHEQFLQTQCTECANQLQDTDLKSYATQLAQQHQKTYQQLLSLLNA